MLRLFVLLQITLLGAEHRVRSARSERGSVTVEHVLWAVAVIAIVAIVVAAVKAYVTSQSGKLK
jgi:heme/copper-type cytochrome/quinol oxidase subunit 2